MTHAPQRNATSFTTLGTAPGAAEQLSSPQGIDRAEHAGDEQSAVPKDYGAAEQQKSGNKAVHHLPPLWTAGGRSGAAVLSLGLIVPSPVETFAARLAAISFLVRQPLRAAADRCCASVIIGVPQ